MILTSYCIFYIYRTQDTYYIKDSLSYSDSYQNEAEILSFESSDIIYYGQSSEKLMN